MSGNRHNRRWRKKNRPFYRRRATTWSTAKLLLPPLITFGIVLAYLGTSMGVSNVKKALALTTPQPEVGEVLRVIDGDTIEAYLPGHGREHIRISSIDAPEIGQPFGAQSTQCLRDILREGPLGVKRRKTDQHGRLVADLFIGDERVDIAMVERGCAWWYSRYAPASLALATAHFMAKHEKRGLWADKKPMKPEQWRRQN
ncbi:thermonuclease family protein [Parahaliea mediterranea]|uniref:thermonuclease family protein n=1 Tax=Parahaliea mediterranea TaxID=651086 RepID=UPI0013003912|nr:thermonuclease family protein [Parahaliea mediterranea]